MLMPVDFDLNEIYILAVGFLLTSLFLLLPERFSRIEAILILLFNFYLVAITDQILAGDVLDFYDIMDLPEFEIMDFYVYIFVYPVCGYLFLYILQKLKQMRIFTYLLLSVLVTLGLEKLSILFDVFHYNNWNMILSGISYTLIYAANIYFLRLITYLKKQNS